MAAIPRLFARRRPPDSAQTVCAGFAERGLFIVGHARSGTTVMQNALNASPDIYLLGEPDLHRQAATAGFAARYGAMHRSWGNQETKSTALPPVLDNDPQWWHWLARLADLHQRVGSKIVLNPSDDPSHAVLQAFQGRLFYKSTYLFCFRDPLAIAVSTRRLAELNGGGVASWDGVADSMLAVMRLYIRMLRLFPHVHAVFHDSLDGDSFARLGRDIGCDLSGAAGYYDSSQVKQPEPNDVPEAFRTLYGNLARVHDMLRACVADGPALVQLDQNVNNFSPGHRTALGQLAMVLEPGPH